PYILSLLKVGQTASIVGELDIKKKPLIIGRDFELVKGELIHTGRIVPVYSEIYGLSSRTIREKVWRVIQSLGENQIPDELPEVILKNESLISLDTALRQIHFPSSLTQLNQAKMRLGFDELFYIQLSSQMIKNEWRKERVVFPFRIDGSIEHKIQSFIELLPFKLTKDQLISIADIKTDLAREYPMNRFLQGDVGSGKTVVAAVAAYIAYLNNTQTLIMAPTEILAEQHYKSFQALFAKLHIKIALQTGSHKSITTSDKIKYDIIIGTQALLTKGVRIDSVGFIVIDEQHRFGVAQRAMLREKGGHPHLLTMTATPIPRTVALTLYGELDLSAITTMPSGRIPIKSFVVPPQKRFDAYEWIKKQVDKHHSQVFIICPLVKESEVETMKSVKAVTAEYKILKTKIFPEFSVGLLHGKLKAIEKNKLMEEFRANKHEILLSTSVVEVGIDIPNATIMLIEGAERFGLAQLHQLRGRVGRGALQSYCLLFTSNDNPQSAGRLAFFARTENGAELAAYDLKLRGPGSIFGTMQHGYVDLKIASLTDTALIYRARKEVESVLALSPTLLKFPGLLTAIKQKKVDHVSRD
ncbi:DNA helicase RecG, partial [Candidatus Roizmanbacteria bacterium CG_4_10_14_0_8_um_filter_39_9]